MDNQVTVYKTKSSAKRGAERLLKRFPIISGYELIELDNGWGISISVSCTKDEFPKVLLELAFVDPEFWNEPKEEVIQELTPEVEKAEPAPIEVAPVVDVSSIAVTQRVVARIQNKIRDRVRPNSKGSICWKAFNKFVIDNNPPGMVDLKDLVLPDSAFAKKLAKRHGWKEITCITELQDWKRFNGYLKKLVESTTTA